MTDLPERKRIRLGEYDYSADGAYFVTICTKNRENILWETTAELQPNNDMVIDHKQPNAVGANRVRPPQNDEKNNVVLSNIGEIVNDAILAIPKSYECVNVDNYVIMPNHIHMIISISDNADYGENGRTRFAPTISRIIKQTKGRATKQIGYSIWQKSFYDHIIRTQRDYAQIWQYVDENPTKWESDEYYEQ